MPREGVAARMRVSFSGDFAADILATVVVVVGEVSLVLVLVLVEDIACLLGSLDCDFVPSRWFSGEMLFRTLLVRGLVRPEEDTTVGF